MRDHGYIEGQNLLIERRSGGGGLSEVQPQELSAPAAELVALPVDVIFAAGGTVAAVAARQATSTIPIVSPSGDLVGVGLVASLARPGGNVTGLTTISPQLSGKRMELLKEAVPGVSRVAAIWNPGSATASGAMRETQAAAESLGLEVYPLPVRSPSELAPAFETARAQVDAVTVMGDPLMLTEAVQIAGLAASSRLPAMYASRAYPDAGGLMGYGANLPDQHRRAASYIDKILKGAKPADLPVEQPREFDFVINLKTAQALGLTIPQHVLLQASEVIQ
jgi:putative ABC transport system substrate-binding protein